MKKYKIIYILIMIILLAVIGYIIIKNISLPVSVTNVSYRLNEDKAPVIKFDIKNRSKEDLKNGIIYIEFYNKNKILYTSKYNLKELKKDSILTIETVSAFDFNYKDITNYFIKYNNYTIYRGKIKKS